MMAWTRATVRRWGSSLATVIPPEILRREGLHEGDEIVLEVRKARSLKDFVGWLRATPIDAQKMKDELRKEDNE